MADSAPIEPPIVLVSDDIGVFDSVAAAESHMECWQVSDARAFDSGGRLLRVGTREWKPDPLVTIHPGETEPSHAEELRSLLADWLRRVGTTEEVISASALPQLVERVAASHRDRPLPLPGRIAEWWMKHFGWSKR